MRHLDVALILCSISLVSACGSDDDQAEKTPATFAEQVTRGSDVFSSRCSSCHGDAGEGTAKAPAVVGPGSLPLDPPSGAKVRTSQFVTVADVAEFVSKTMPGDAPGSLSESDYFAVLAFDLHANGIDLDMKLDAAVAASLTIPRD
jgi:cytochrome c